MPNFPSAGIPTMPISHLERYYIGWDNPDGSRTISVVEAFSEENAQEIAEEELLNTFPTFAEKLEEPEEPDKPIVI